MATDKRFKRLARRVYPLAGFVGGHDDPRHRNGASPIDHAHDNDAESEGRKEMERETGFEPATACLEGRNSTTELLPLTIYNCTKKFARGSNGALGWDSPTADSHAGGDSYAVVQISPPSFPRNQEYTNLNPLSPSPYSIVQ